ncbi:hypothetical protein JHK82_016873 [Glycine max]|nr:hypothetical protein JHK85_017290 [Glycine max]KAG5149992.1 hypothetical protein JHK82_016873 [Glycine max]KHN41168.1 hypothetical protein glysoja_017212 [Glycine soja]
MRVRRGDFSLFYDRWLEEVPICEALDYAHITDTHLGVKNYLIHDTWQWKNIATPLPPDLKNKLLSVVLDDTTDDDRCCTLESNFHCDLFHLICLAIFGYLTCLLFIRPF